MRYTDSHNHTMRFSGDARMTPEELIAGAANMGLLAIVITEHYEKDYPYDCESNQIFDIDTYFEAFREWKKNLPKDFTIYSGIELGYMTHLGPFFDELIAKYPFDSVILSDHLFHGKDPYYEPCYDMPKGDLYSAYVLELTNMVTACNQFDILGHYDYIARYATYDDPTMKYKDSPEAFDQIFRALISKNKSLEINTRSIQKYMLKGIHDCMPDKELLYQYKKLGGDRLTLGSDSHDTRTLGLLFDETAEHLRSCGFDELTTFIGRKEMRTSMY